MALASSANACPWSPWRLAIGYFANEFLGPDRSLDQSARAAHVLSNECAPLWETCGGNGDDGICSIQWRSHLSIYRGQLHAMAAHAKSNPAALLSRHYADPPTRQV